MTQDRISAAVLAIVLQALIGYGLISQLGVAIITRPQSALKLFEIAPAQPPAARPQAPPPPSRAQLARRAPAPPNLHAQPLEIAAPKPVLPLPVPVIAAPIAGPGNQPSAGAASTAGPGTGAGGMGPGAGGGGGGEGEGEGDFSPPRHIAGRIRDSDYPEGLGDEGVGRTITVQFTVAETGRVTGCAVLHSSGVDALDRATCRAIERRYRFRPSRDADGRPAEAMVVEDHVWRKGRD